MKTSFLKYLTLTAVICFIIAQKGFGQEVLYTNGGLNYYWNPFETATPASDIGTFAYRSNVPANYTFTSTNAQTPLNGGYSLSTVNRATPLANGISKQIIGGNFSTSATYEWAILYKYSTNDPTNSSDIVDYTSVAAGKCGWRYWFAADAATPTTGLYMTQVGKTLKFNAPGQGFFYTVDIVPGTTYSIKFKVINNGTIVIYMDAYSPLKTEASTKIKQTNFGLSMNSYSYTVLEANEARAATYHCQWDDIKLYIPTFAVTSITSTANGLSNTTLQQGQKNAIVYGFSIKSRGAFNIKEIDVSDDLGNSTQALAGAKLYYSSDNFFSTADSPVNTFSIPTSSALNYSTTSINLGGTDQTGTTYYYFYVIDLLSNALFNNITFKSLSVQYDNNNGYVTFVSPSTNGNAYSVSQSFNWVGGTNTDFNTASNWSLTQMYQAPVTPSNPPTSSSYVYIPSSAGNNPVSTSTNVTLAGLSMDAGKSLTLSNADLTVSNILSSNSTIAFTGTAANTFTVNAGANTYLESLSVIKGAKATTLTLATSNSSKINLTGTLNLQNATLATAGLLVLKSSATKTANVSRLDQTTAGTIDAVITGSVAAERYVTGGSGYNSARSNYTYRNYRIMSSPVYTGTNGTDNIYNLQYIPASSVVTGATGGTLTTGNPTLYLYREDYAGTNATFTSSNFRGISAITSTGVTVDANTRYLYPGTGYLFYFRGNNTGVTAKTTSPYVAPESVIFSNTGTLNQGDITVKNWLTASTTLAKTTVATASSQGLQLVGNPYPSSIDWDAAGGFGGTASVDNTIYTFNPVSGQYEAYVKNTGGIGGSRSNANIITSGQAFFIKILSDGTFIFKEAAKSTTQPTGLNLLLGKPVNTTEKISFARIKLALDSLNNDNAVLIFKDGADDKYVDTEDGIDLGGSGVLESLSVRSSDDVSLAVNTLSLPKKSDKIVPLSVDAYKTGLYTISLTDIENIPAIYQVWLRDKLKKDSLDIRANKIYTFNLDKADATTYGKDRFEIVMRQNPQLALKLLDFSASKVTTGVQLNWVSENEENYTNFTVERSIDGGKTFEVVGGFASSNIGKYALVDKSPIIGLNQYRLKQDDINGDISYSKPANVMYSKMSNNITANVITVYPNPVSSAVNITFTPKANAKSYNISITNSSGILMTKTITTQSEWQTNVGNFLPGTYFVRVTDNGTNTLIGNNKFIKL